MKKVLFILAILMATSTATFPQKGGKPIAKDFEAFIDLFPYIDFPFNASYDSLTYFDGSLVKDIPKPLYDKFICANGIKCFSDICDDKFFLGFAALFKFNYSKDFYTMLTAMDAEAGCGEKWYLITYTSNGEFINQLLVFGTLSLKRPSKSDKSASYVSVQSIINNNVIKITHGSYDYDNKNELIKEVKKTSEYNLQPDGKFKLITEKSEIIK